MYWAIDEHRKIIFGWTPKCACTHVKILFYYLTQDEIVQYPHGKMKFCLELPKNISEYISILIVRNPYERIISGFLDKYHTNSIIRKAWNRDTITFSDFVDELIVRNWKRVNHHHFAPQTEAGFSCKIMMSKKVILYDIKNIDYKFISRLYNKPIHHEAKKVRNKTAKNGRGAIDDPSKYKFVYNKDIMSYIKYRIPPKYFYNAKIKKKVYEFYKNDFIFFRNLGIKYKFPD